jgi:hypothetical protein
MQKPLKLSASVLFAAGTIALANASPAQAACTGVGNNMPGGGASTFGAYTLGTAYNAGNGFCFTLNSFAAGFLAGDQLDVSTTSTSTALTSSRSAGFTGTNSFNYTWSRFSPDPSGLYLSQYSGIVSSDVTPNPTNTATMTWDPAIGSGPTITSNAITVDFLGAPVNFSNSGSYTYPYPSVRSETFTASMNVSAGQMRNFSASTTWAPIPPAPGPLPLLGAGAAFGFSRKLRSRIKLSA